MNEHSKICSSLLTWRQKYAELAKIKKDIFICIDFSFIKNKKLYSTPGNNIDGKGYTFDRSNVNIKYLTEQFKDIVKKMLPYYNTEQMHYNRMLSNDRFHFGIIASIISNLHIYINEIILFTSNKPSKLIDDNKYNFDYLYYHIKNGNIGNVIPDLTDILYGTKQYYHIYDNYDPIIYTKKTNFLVISQFTFDIVNSLYQYKQLTNKIQSYKTNNKFDAFAIPANIPAVSMYDMYCTLSKNNNDIIEHYKFDPGWFPLLMNIYGMSKNPVLIFTFSIPEKVYGVDYTPLLIDNINELQKIPTKWTLTDNVLKDEDKIDNINFYAEIMIMIFVFSLLKHVRLSLYVEMVYMPHIIYNILYTNLIKDNKVYFFVLDFNYIISHNSKIYHTDTLYKALYVIVTLIKSSNNFASKTDRTLQTLNGILFLLYNQNIDYNDYMYGVLNI